MKKRIIAAVTAVCMMAASMTGCTEAERATYNVQKEADYFNVERRLSVINARTDKPILELIGYFSLSNNSDNELVITPAGTVVLHGIFTEIIGNFIYKPVNSENDRAFAVYLYGNILCLSIAAEKLRRFRCHVQKVNLGLRDFHTFIKA